MNRLFTIITTSSPKIAELTAVTISNKATYAAKHQHRLELINKADNYPLADFHRDVLSIALSYLKLGRSVMLMEADAIFTNMEVQIVDRIHPKAAIVVAREPAPYSPVNLGVMLMNNSAAAIKYCEIVLDRFVEWKDDPLVYQAWTANRLDFHFIKDALTIVAPREINAIPSERPGYPHDDRAEVWRPGDWIAHAYGFPIETKARILRDLLVNKSSVRSTENPPEADL